MQQRNQRGSCRWFPQNWKKKNQRLFQTYHSQEGHCWEKQRWHRQEHISWYCSSFHPLAVGAIHHRCPQEAQSSSSCTCSLLPRGFQTTPFPHSRFLGTPSLCLGIQLDPCVLFDVQTWETVSSCYLWVRRVLFFCLLFGLVGLSHDISKTHQHQNHDPKIWPLDLKVWNWN